MSRQVASIVAWAGTYAGLDIGDKRGKPEGLYNNDMD
jgi:hypothetical protein